MRYAALTISTLAHPFLLPLYLLFITFNSGTMFSLTPGYAQATAYALTIMGVVLVPLLSIPILKYFEMIEHVDMRHRQDRIVPLFITVVSVFVIFYLSRKIPYLEIVRQIYLVLVVWLSGFMLVTIRWKISMHMSAMGALCGFVFILGVKYMGAVSDLLMFFFLVAGLLGFSRIYLKCHTPAQVYAGFLYGFALVTLILI